MNTDYLIKNKEFHLFYKVLSGADPELIRGCWNILQKKLIIEIYAEKL